MTLSIISIEKNIQEKLTVSVHVHACVVNLKLAFTGTLLRENKFLTFLHLGSCGLGSEGICEVCNGVGVNTKLTLLNQLGKFF